MRFLFSAFLSSLFFSVSAVERLPYVLGMGVSGCDTIYSLPTKEANFIGGNDEMYDFYFKNLKSSESLTINMSPNIVLVKIVVDDAGTVKSARILRSFNPEYNQDILDVTNSFPILQPAVFEGRNVCSTKIVKLYYK